MAKTIWKFSLHLFDSGATVQVPSEALARFVAIDPATRSPALWIELDPEALKVERRFNIYGTGHVLRNEETYVGSVIDGPFVWHVFEQLR